MLDEAAFADMETRQIPPPILCTGQIDIFKLRPNGEWRRRYLDWVITDLILDTLDNLVHPFHEKILYFDTIINEVT